SGDLFAFAQQLTPGDDMIDKPQPQGLSCVKAVAGVQHCERAPYWNEPGQALRSACRRQSPKAGIAQAKTAQAQQPPGCHTTGLLQPNAIGMAIDRSNERFAQLRQQGKREMVGCCAEPGEIVGFHVRADTKRAVTRAGENT